MIQKTSKAKNKTGSDSKSLVSTDPLLGRSVPQSPEAEAAVLGSMVLDHECISQIVQELSGDSFYRHEHRIIFEAIISLYENPQILILSYYGMN